MRRDMQQLLQDWATGNAKVYKVLDVSEDASAEEIKAAYNAIGSEIRKVADSLERGVRERFVEAKDLFLAAAQNRPALKPATNTASQETQKGQEQEPFAILLNYVRINALPEGGVSARRLLGLPKQTTYTFEEIEMARLFAWQALYRVLYTETADSRAWCLVELAYQKLLEKLPKPEQQLQTIAQPEASDTSDTSDAAAASPVLLLPASPVARRSVVPQILGKTQIFTKDAFCDKKFGELELLSASAQIELMCHFGGKQRKLTMKIVEFVAAVEKQYCENPRKKLFVAGQAVPFCQKEFEWAKNGFGALPGSPLKERQFSALTPAEKLWVGLQYAARKPEGYFARALNTVVLTKSVALDSITLATHLQRVARF